MPHFGTYNTSDATTGNTPLVANGVVTFGPMQTDMAQNIVGSIFTDQAGTLFIEQSFDGAAAAGATVLTCATTNGQVAVSIQSLNTLIPHVGATVSGTGITAGTTVAAAPAPTATDFALSANATATGVTALTISEMGSAHWDISTSIAVVASTGASFSQAIIAPNVRLRFVNGATPQTVMRLFARAFVTGR